MESSTRIDLRGWALVGHVTLGVLVDLPEDVVVVELVGHPVPFGHALQDLDGRRLVRRVEVDALQTLDERLVRRDVLVELLVGRRRDDPDASGSRSCEDRLDRLDGGVGELHDLVELVDEEHQFVLLVLDEALGLVEEALEYRGHVLGVARLGDHARRVHFEIEAIRIHEHRGLDQCGLTRSGLGQQQRIAQLGTAHRGQQLHRLALTADDVALSLPQRLRELGKEWVAPIELCFVKHAAQYLSTGLKIQLGNQPESYHELHSIGH